MGVITETHTIKANLLVQGTSYPMLEVEPRRHHELHFLLRENCFQFLVVHQGFAQNIIVGRQSFAILPVLESYELEVNFIVEDKEEQPETNLINVVKDWSPIITD